MTQPSRASPRPRPRPLGALVQTLVYRDPFAYCSHPSIVALANGAWLLAFLETVRREVVLHSPSDPRFYTVLTRSRDDGRTWSRPVVAPGYDWYGVECPSLTRLTSGDVLLLQWRWRWAPWPPEAGERRTGLYEHPDLPWSRGDDGTYVHRSGDGGLTWELGTRIDTAPYAGAYTTRSAVELADGTLVYAVTDIPRWRRVYVLRSSDGGSSWVAGALVASDPDRQYSEPCILRRGERLLVLIREEVTGFLHQSVSGDGGWTWDRPRPTPMWGGPPHLLELGDGRLLCTYGHRRPPYGIRGCVSEDGGETWAIGAELALRAFPNANLGYPSSVLVAPGRAFTASYGEDDEGVTGIYGTAYDA